MEDWKKSRQAPFIPMYSESEDEKGNERRYNEYVELHRCVQRYAESKLCTRWEELPSREDAMWADPYKVEAFIRDRWPQVRLPPSLDINLFRWAAAIEHIRGASTYHSRLSAAINNHWLEWLEEKKAARYTSNALGLIFEPKKYVEFCNLYKVTPQSIINHCTGMRGQNSNSKALQPWINQLKTILPEDVKWIFEGSSLPRWLGPYVQACQALWPEFLKMRFFECGISSTIDSRDDADEIIRHFIRGLVVTMSEFPYFNYLPLLSRYCTAMRDSQVLLPVPWYEALFINWAINWETSRPKKKPSVTYRAKDGSIRTKTGWDPVEPQADILRRNALTAIANRLPDAKVIPPGLVPEISFEMAPTRKTGPRGPRKKRP